MINNILIYRSPLKHTLLQAILLLEGHILKYHFHQRLNIFKVRPLAKLTRIYYINFSTILQKTKTLSLKIVSYINMKTLKMINMCTN